MEKSAQRRRQNDRQHRTANADFDQQALAAGQQPLQAALVILCAKVGDVMNQRRAERLQGQTQECGEVEGEIRVTVLGRAKAMAQHRADRQIADASDKTEDRPDNATAP